MDSPIHTRREVLAGLTAATVAATAGVAPIVGANAPAAVLPPPAFQGQHAPLPLPFDPKRLTGLSEGLLVSHHDNNYAGAVKNLNRVELELAQVTKDTPPFVVGGLRQSELLYRNSMLLHEAYFGNLGGNGKPDGPVVAALVAAYGSYEAWLLHARATAASLAGGSGWVVLAFELGSGRLRTVGAINHTQSLATSLPLLVMDMYEHAYAIDYGAAATRYIDAFLANVHWDAVNRRLEQAEKVSAVMRI